MSEIAYIRHIADYRVVFYKPLNPTGRWMMKTGPFYENKMFVEHRGWIFRRWIGEEDICFGPPESSAVFDCGAD